MSLRAIVASLGGDLYANGVRANVPAPGHGAADRSISLVMTGDRVVVHSFGGPDWREVLDDLRRRGLIDDRARLTGAGGGGAPPRLDDGARVEVARTLWSGGVETGADGLVARHLRRRGVVWTPALQDLREHPAAPLNVYGRGSRGRRAMMVRICDGEGEMAAVELTYLSPNGDRARDLRVSRKTIGHVPAGSAVRLGPAAASLLVGEGVITTLSAMAWFDRPGWALLSAGNLARWSAPESVRDVLIAGDRGAAGETAARTLCGRLCAEGVAATVALPARPWGDWNEALTARSRQRSEEGRGGAPEKRG